MEITNTQTVLFFLLIIISFAIFTTVFLNSIRTCCNLYDTLIELEKKEKAKTRMAVWNYLFISLISGTVLIWIIHTTISMLINILRI